LKFKLFSDIRYKLGQKIDTAIYLPSGLKNRETRQKSDARMGSAMGLEFNENFALRRAAGHQTHHLRGCALGASWVISILPTTLMADRKNRSRYFILLGRGILIPVFRLGTHSWPNLD
jgi:capsid portal protein